MEGGLKVEITVRKTRNADNDEGFFLAFRFSESCECGEEKMHSIVHLFCPERCDRKDAAKGLRMLAAEMDGGLT